MTKKSDNGGLRRDKNQKEKKKWERLPWERLWRCKRKYCFHGQKKIIFMGVVMCCVRESLFSDLFFFFFINNLQKISLIFVRVFHWLKIVFYWPIFLCYQTLKKVFFFKNTIFMKDFLAKQTKHKIVLIFSLEASLH